ncbi:hypothetical protein SAMN05216379_1047 [Nitrosomonas eutropha]|uniref:Uncharacterized protein n=1 Tax=Nitrosomonas eutropha TaxID=916 RepID=A0ABX5M9K4_9PROT|nr:hypothetical protein C8R14_1026 [Nitrosomonas eutropha]SCX06454.1 hypothetical protein SAMN05216379_1047 [Nitrosomonas eutropha]
MSTAYYTEGIYDLDEALSDFSPYLPGHRKIACDDPGDNGWLPARRAIVDAREGHAHTLHKRRLSG